MTLSSVAQAVANGRSTVRFKPSRKLVDEATRVVDWLTTLPECYPAGVGKLSNISFEEAVAMSRDRHQIFGTRPRETESDRLRLSDEVIEAVRRFHRSEKQEGSSVQLHGERLTDRYDTLRATFEAVLAPIGLGIDDIRAMSVILHSVRPQDWIDEDTGEVDSRFNPTLIDMPAEEIDECALGWGVDENSAGGFIWFSATLWTDSCVLKFAPRFDRVHFTWVDVIPVEPPHSHTFTERSQSPGFR